MIKSLDVLLISLFISCSFLGEGKAFDHNQWCGKYPFHGFFEDKTIKQEMESFLSQAQINYIKSNLATVSPIWHEDSFIIARGCKQHDCPSEDYMLVLSPIDKKRYLCLWKALEGSWGRGTMIFYSSSFSKRLVFRNIYAKGCIFTEEGIKEFIKEIKSSSGEESAKNAVKKLVEKGLRRVF